MSAKKKSPGPSSTLANRVESVVEKPKADPFRKGNAPWPENDAMIVEVLPPASDITDPGSSGTVTSRSKNGKITRSIGGATRRSSGKR